MKRALVAVFLLLSILQGTCFGERWAFVAIGDNRSAYSSYRNVLEEIRDQTVNPDHSFPAADFVLACGDLDPVAKNFEIYESVFNGKKPLYFPVRGNHERRRDVRFILDRLLTPFRDRIELRDRPGVNYYTDWKNTRLIVLDQYSDFNDTFSNDAAVEWVRAAIQSATKAAHIFVAFHEPVRAGDPPTGRFWRLLMEHKDKVRAVFAGHIHFHDHQQVPDEPGGIDYINVGNSGWTSHSDGKQTLVNVMVNDGEVTYRVVQAPNETRQFRLKKQWHRPGKS